MSLCGCTLSNIAAVVVNANIITRVNMMTNVITIPAPTTMNLMTTHDADDKNNNNNDDSNHQQSTNDEEEEEEEEKL